MRQRKIKIKGKEYELPIFLPDATLGVVRSLSTTDLKDSGVRGCVVNTYHLFDKPGKNLLEKYNGIKKFMGFDGLVVSDSGGWQVFSLIHRSNNKGTITDEGVTFSINGKRKEIFTPEDSIAMQFEIGSDIVICLDDFTPPNASKEKIIESVNRTTLWAKRCKEEYARQIIKRNLNDSTRPLIFAVIQGDRDKDLRKKSSEELIEIGFDGYGYGGYMIDENAELDLEMSEYIVKELIPKESFSFALGTGTPWQIANLYSYGWDIFDCTLPTRDARHERLYFFNDPSPTPNDLRLKESYILLNIGKNNNKEDTNTLSDHCGCSTCRSYTKAYLHHLFKIKDISAYRLATIHNLYFYNQLISMLSKQNL